MVPVGMLSCSLRLLGVSMRQTEESFQHEGGSCLSRGRLALAFGACHGISSDGILPRTNGMADLTIGCDISWMWSPKDYWYATISALIGVLLGIGWSESRYRRMAVERAKAARAGLVASLVGNRDLAVQAKGQIENKNFPNYSFDVASLIRWIDRAHDSLPAETLRQVDGLRFQLEHVSNKMQMLYSIAATDGSDKAAEHPECGSVLRHLGLIEGWIDERKSEIERDDGEFGAKKAKADMT